jgi:GTP cyclohydrolase IA
MVKKTVVLTNEEIFERSVSLMQRIRSQVPREEQIRIYGVPRGGLPVAYALTHFPNVFVADKMAEANVIVDDIVATGKTRAKFSKVGLPFFALIEYPDAGVWYVFPWEGSTLGSADDIPTRFLEFIGEDPKRDGLKDSPARVVRSWGDLYRGYSEPFPNIAVFDNEEKYDEMVTLRNIEFYSTCEHHFLPFFGKVHISYIPGPKVVGISKLARIVDFFARRLQIQERLTKQIANALQDALNPAGIGVMVQGQHMCMLARGVKQSESYMVTTALNGIVKEDPKARAEFLNVCRG